MTHYFGGYFMVALLHDRARSRVILFALTGYLLAVSAAIPTTRLST